MASYVGVDWASRGWIAVGIEEDQDWTAEMHPSFHSVWFCNRDADRILVDVPIGLPSDERRACDAEAKAFLGSAGASRVFWTPSRDAVYASTYDEAKTLNQAALGNSVSSQAWWFSPRIREVDEFLLDTQEARSVVRESHPEICFKSFSPAAPGLSSKHGSDGLDARVEILDATEPGAKDQYDSICERHITTPPEWSRRIGESKRDDLLDAMALAITAKQGEARISRLPKRFEESVHTDAKGLPMEIVFAE